MLEGTAVAEESCATTVERGISAAKTAPTRARETTAERNRAIRSIYQAPPTHRQFVSAIGLPASNTGGPLSRATRILRVPIARSKSLPYADPEKSFDAAVNHLFRHVADASALRKNPLTATFFSRAKTVPDDTAALFSIRNRIACETDACCSDAAISDSGEGARRQRAIVEAILASEDIGQAAKRLRLSRRQYYRERHAICSNLAPRMRSAKDASRLRAFLRTCSGASSVLTGAGSNVASTRRVNARMAIAAVPFLRLPALEGRNGKNANA
jgi:hypothetical protein